MATTTPFFEYFAIIAPALLRGLWFTLSLFALTLIISLPLGLLFTLARISRLKVLNLFSGAYIWVFRGTPLMLQLYFFYFFLPKISPVMLNEFATAVLTFALNYAAYFAEIFRAGIESIDKGQFEAADSLGISRSRTMLGIILPQTIKRVIPPVANEAITLVKDTALASCISIGELMKASKGAVNRDVRADAYLWAAVIYLLLTFLLTVLTTRLEKSFSKYEPGQERKHRSGVFAFGEKRKEKA